MIRILLAEDEDAMRSYLTRALENAGYEVVAVDRGTAALPLLEERAFRPAAVGHRHAGNGRHRTGAALRRRSARSTKVMFITGFAAVTLRASREAPQAKVLSKPFHLRDLVLEVERVFGRSGVCQPLIACTNRGH